MALKGILLDTNAYAAFMKGDADAVEILQASSNIGLSVIVVGELLSGFAGGTRETSNREELGRFFESPRVSLIPVDRGTAEMYYRVYMRLKQSGHPIPTNDMWIAATALQHGLAVFTFDKHYHNIREVVSGCRLKELTL